jgi:hypothetical protein
MRSIDQALSWRPCQRAVMLAVSSSFATLQGVRPSLGHFMKSAVCVKGHTTNQCSAAMAHGIYEKYLLFKLYQCFLTCFTEASLRASLRVSYAHLLVVTCMITPSLLPRVRPSCGCLAGVGIKAPLLSQLHDSTNTTELNTLRLLHRANC